MAVDDAYTKILLHFDDDDGETSVIDEAGNTWNSVTYVAEPPDVFNEIDNVHYKFGGTSLKTSSLTGLELDGGFTSDLNPGSGDFTIDFWVYLTELPTEQTGFYVSMHGSPSDHDFSIEIVPESATTFSFVFWTVSSIGSNSLAMSATSPIEITTGAFHHFEACRYGNSYLLFWDGDLKDTKSLAAHSYNILGGWYAINSNIENLWLDEYRYSKGIARNTSGFTPPTGAYSGDILESISETMSISDLMTPLRLAENVSEGSSISDVMEPLRLAENIPEALSISDAMEPLRLAENISEGISASAEMLGYGAIEESIGESASIGDLFFGTYAETINESLFLGDELVGAYPVNISDSMFIYDESRVGWKFSIDESIVLTDAVDKVLGLLISDWITLIDTQSNNWNGREIISDAINLFDVAQGSKRYVDTVDETLNVADSATYALTVLVLEYMGFHDLAAALKTSAAVLNDEIGFSDISEVAIALAIQEALELVDTNSVITTFIESVQEAIGLTDAATLIARLGASVNESLVLVDTNSTHAHLFSAVYETLAMNVTVELSGEYFECYVLNTPSFHPSMYSGMDFNSYCVFENRSFGANDTGIFELTGSTDAGSEIHTGAILSQSDFGLPNQKRIRRGYFGISGTSPVMVLEGEDGTRQVFSIDTEGKAVGSHELKSKKWKLSIADFSELSTIKLIPVILSK